MTPVSDIPTDASVRLSTALTKKTKPVSYRSHLPPSLARWTVFALDLLVASITAAFVMYDYHLTFWDISLRSALPYILIPVSAMTGLAVAGAYKLSFARSMESHLLRTLNGSGVGLGLLGISIYSISTSPAKYILPIVLTWIMIGFMHFCYMLIMKHLFKAGYLSEKVIVIGATSKAERMISRNRNSGEMRVLGVFDDRLQRAPDSVENVPVLGSLDDLMVWDRLPEVDRIIVTVTSDARTRVQQLIGRLRVLPHRILLMLDLTSFDIDDDRMTEIGASPAAYVSGEQRDIGRAFVKRITDLVFGTLLLIGFAPIILVCAILIKLEDGGPIFFRQLRQGFNNELIRVWKLRSMRPDDKAADRMEAQTTKDDPRVTRIGKFIRATSIDELPQLFNILKGDMSLVGPRPHAVGMTAESTIVHEIVADYAHRHRAKPGLTGWAQINGSRGPVHTHAEVRERVRLDMEYLRRSSFFFDIYIMLMTAPCLLGDRKANR